MHDAPEECVRSGIVGPWEPFRRKRGFRIDGSRAVFCAYALFDRVRTVEHGVADSGVGAFYAEIVRVVGDGVDHDPPGGPFVRVEGEAFDRLPVRCVLDEQFAFRTDVGREDVPALFQV